MANNAWEELQENQVSKPRFVCECRPKGFTDSEWNSAFDQMGHMDDCPFWEPLTLVGDDYYFGQND